MAMMGFAPQALASVRHFKLTGAKVTRNICTYCSVGCGVAAVRARRRRDHSHDHIFHVEGDPDHPVSRGSLCPRGAGVLDFIKSDSRVRYPQVREPYRRVEAHQLGRGARPHRPPDEGRPRPQFRDPR